MNTSSIRAALTFYTNKTVSSSMIGQIKRKLKEKMEGKYDENMPLIPGMMQKWRREGHHVSMKVINGVGLKNIVLDIAKKAWRKEMKRRDEDHQEPFDKSLVNVEKINDEAMYPVGHGVVHHGLTLMSNGDPSRRDEQDASHNKGALKGSHFGCLRTNGNHKIIIQQLGWNIHAEGGRPWTQFQESMEAATPERSEFPGKS